MASKDQKFDKYSNNIKELVMQDIRNGKSINYISKIYNIPHGTVSKWHQKIIHPELNVKTEKKRGRLKEGDLTREDYKERYEILKKYQTFLKEQRERK